MDVCKAQFLKPKHLSFLHENIDAILDKKIVKAEAKSERAEIVKEHVKWVNIIDFLFKNLF